jgi:LysR family transcriptional regulator, regulator for metE and metH
MKKLERQHLEIISAVEKYGSISAAAEKLYLTQSALSHAIKKLEEGIGVTIWQKEGKKRRLTQAGQYLLSSAKSLLTHFERTEAQLKEFAAGQRGLLKIGMECHPCYQWLLKIVAPYLAAWPLVDLDVKQKFQFGGIGALLNHEIDILVTPDPPAHTALHFVPVFDYEQVLLLSKQHPLLLKAESLGQKYLQASDLATETLITYPVATERLDIFQQFLNPAGVAPKQHKCIETTDIILQMVASGRGVSALPRWLIEEQQARFELGMLSLGKEGIAKKIYLGLRVGDLKIDYLNSFLIMAKNLKS